MKQVASEKVLTADEIRELNLTSEQSRMTAYWQRRVSDDKAVVLGYYSFANETIYQRLKKEWTG